MTATGAVSALPPWQWPRAAYLHIPFCAHHCGYCDFAVITGKDHLSDRYVAALAREMSFLGTPQPVASIFLGGGTPTHLAEAVLERLLDAVVAWLRLEPGGEFSVEANPDTLTADKVRLLARYGVNRVSLGVQSFQPGHLLVLERQHRPEEVLRAVERIRAAIDQLSLDLIFGVPGQTLADWNSDLACALALQPEHVSTYGLTYEKGTRLWKQRARGGLIALGEDEELALYQHGIATLEAAGFEHYEISNFARPGCRSRHNQVYWANEAYFGFGLGAARYLHGRREVNTRDLARYLRQIEAGEPATQQGEQLSANESARETMVIQLRRVEGIDREAFLKRTGRPLDEVAGPALPQLVAQGFLADEGRRICLTRQGMVVADAVIEKLLR